ncbi:MAG: glycosyltransferase [Anaerolineales bacterium]|jgi:glycosyltransferase involved in cell wall biosynthesis
MSRADAPISVVMATYNGGRFIREALESIFRQHHPPAEIIVVDDGSTDGTFQVLQPILGRIRYFPEPHRGVSAARNCGIAQARGELIAFLDADDYYLPEHLERLAERLAANPRAGLVHSGWRFVQADGTLLRQVEPWQDAPRLDLRGWLIWKPARMGATLVERRWLERAGGFDETLPQSADVDLMLRLAWRGCRSVWLREATLCCRLHADNLTRQGVVQAEALDLVLDRFFSLPGLPGNLQRMERRVRHDTTVWAAWHLWRTGYRPQAEARLRASLALADWPAPQSALRWMMRFHAWGQGQDVPPSQSQETRLLLREAAGISREQWDRVETQYDWFCRVWWPCSQGEPWDLGSLMKEPVEDGHLLTDLTVPILVGAPRPVDARSVRAVWDELERRGLVRGAARHEVMTLYLAVLADSLKVQDRRRAWAALGKALAQGLSRVSLRAWLGLLRSGARSWVVRTRLPGGRTAHPPAVRGSLAASPPPCESGLVSVIIAAYNQQPYVAQAVESILSQDYPQREIIVVDDESTDGTAEALTPQAPELTYVRQSHQGPAAARNRGLGIAHGEFILFLDADDFLLPGTLRAHARQLAAHRSHGFSHSGWRLVGTRGEAIADETPWKEVPRLDLEGWLMWKPVFLGGMMFRRDWLERSGGFDTRLVQAEDVDLLLRLALLGSRGDWIPSVTVCRRMHATNITRDSLHQARDLDATLLRFFREQPVPRRIRRLEKRAFFFSLLWISWYLIQSGQADAAAAYLGRTQGYTRLWGTPLVLEWLNDLAGRARREPGGSVPLGRLRALWPVFRRASKMGPGAWEETERALDFWLQVWQPYAQGDTAEGRDALNHFPRLTTRELVEWTQGALLESSQPVRQENLDQLWGEALRAGVVGSEERMEVMGLYLALAARALQRRWRRSLLELAVPALKQLARPRGWGVWLRASAQLSGEVARRVTQWN